MEFLNKARDAIKPERPMQNIKSTARELVARGPLKALVEGSGLVWGTNMERIDGVIGTRLSSGGPFQ